MVLNGEIDTDSLRKTIKEKSFFIERRVAEITPELKQIIPYCMVLNPWQREIFLMQRLPFQGEKRLHGKFSIGVGGHINPVDEMEKGDVLQVGLERELHEEVSIQGREGTRLIGIINDDSNPVGAVHFGLVYALTLGPEGKVAVKEKQALIGEMKPLEQVIKMCNNVEIKFESWSTAVLGCSDKWSKEFF